MNRMLKGVFLAEKFMPKLKYLFVNATTSDLRLLRGKTIECISLIGLAVGKDKVRICFILVFFHLLLEIFCFIN